MIDPLTGLSFAIQANPGVYALLLGSGISRSARIPTGWEVVLDLISRLAAAEGEKPADLETWYREKYEREPDYSDLLDELTNTQSERQHLLRSYFEPGPDPDVSAEGEKQPTPAHRAIARLVRSGYVRVILTTNFDRLIERAIQDEGITPAVVDTPDKVEGMTPLVHQQCVVVKLHGDYLDTRIKNTATELAEYDPRVRDLLLRVLDEFGLIVCGWSGEWDAALRAAIEATPSRRYTFYWAARGKTRGQAAALVEHRVGVVVPIEGADKFFSAVADRVEAIEAAGAEHPMTAQAAAAAAKRYLIRPEERVRLDDLLHDLTSHALEKLNARRAASLDQQHVSKPQRFANFLADSLTDLSVLIAAGMPVARFGTPDGITSLVRSVERVGDDPPPTSGKMLNEGLMHASVLQLLYTLGMAALANDHYEALVRLLREPKVMLRFNQGQKLVIGNFDWYKVHECFAAAHGEARFRDPMSRWLSGHLRPFAERFAPSDERYELLFDSFEAVLRLIYLDVEHPDGFTQDREKWGYRVPAASYMARHRFTVEQFPAVEALLRPQRKQGLLAAGVCEGDETRYIAAVGRLTETSKAWATERF